MSKKPINIAREFGEELPAFNSLLDATDHYERYRQAGLETLAGVAAAQPGFALDYSPESLKSLEDYYFNLIETGGFAGLGVSQPAFESLMGIYFGTVAARNDPAVRWIVQEFAFAPGRYELGVTKGSTTVMVSSLRNLNLMQPHRKRRDRLYRMFQRFFAKGRRESR
jgi:hypothetical protein